MSNSILTQTQYPGIGHTKMTVMYGQKKKQKKKHLTHETLVILLLKLKVIMDPYKEKCFVMSEE